MKIETLPELLALHKCLIEAKFTDNPENFDIAGSPFVAKISNEVVNELKTIQGDSWDTWRKIENHEDKIKRLIAALKMINLNHLRTKDERVQYIINAITPFTANNEKIEELIEKIWTNE